jgi:dienelactone hydrolase
MNIERIVGRGATLLFGLGSAVCVAALPPLLKGEPVFDRAAMLAEMAAYVVKPNQPGTGKFPALNEEDATLPDHVVYHPADLSKLGGTKLGVVAWGNGGCANDGAGGRFHLAQIASHGYLVIASGKILSGPGAPPRPARPAAPPAGAPANVPAAGVPGGIPPPQTHASSLVEAIDWALKENQRKGSPYFGKIDPQQIAVSGWSCGGIQALTVAADARVHAVLIHNSGTFARGASPLAEMDIGKEALKKLHTPVIYIVGGPNDIAYPNAVDDFSKIDHVPVFVASTERGHGGTFLDDNGGIAASVAVSWLNWQLRGDKEAAKRFVGKDCGLCNDPNWSVDSKQVDVRSRYK